MGVAAAVVLELLEMSSIMTLCMLPVSVALWHVGSRPTLPLPVPLLPLLVAPPGWPCSWLAFRMFSGLWANTGDGGMRSMAGMPSSRVRWPPLKMFGGLSSDGDGGLGGYIEMGDVEFK